MKLVIPKSVANVHLLQTEKAVAVPLAGNYPVFHDGAKSGKRLAAHLAQSLPDSFALEDLVETSFQLAYKQLMDLIELFPRMSNIERKQHLIGALLKVREAFYKLIIVCDFIRARQNDLILANVGIRTLVHYSEVVTRMADYMTISFDQVLWQLFPRLPVNVSLRLLSGRPAGLLPRILSTEFNSKLAGGDCTKWTETLNSQVKLATLNLRCPASLRIHRIQDGVLHLQYGKDAGFSLILVPVFESYTYAWHILDLTMDLSSIAAKIILMKLQTKFYRVLVQDSADLLQKLSDELGRLLISLKYSRIISEIEELKSLHISQIEVSLPAEGTVRLQCWPGDKAAPWISFSLKSTVIQVQDSRDQKFEYVDQSVAELVSDLFAAHVQQKLSLAFEKIRSLAPLYWILWQEDQLSLGNSLQIQFPGTTLEVMVSRQDGKYIFHDNLTALLNEGKWESFMKASRQVRVSMFSALLRDRFLSQTSNICMVDPGILSSPILGPNLLCFALKYFPGKLMIADIATCNMAKLYLASEDLTTGRFVFKILSDGELALELSEAFVGHLLLLAENILPKIIEQELEMSDLKAEVISSTQLRLLNVGSLPNVSEIDLKLTSPLAAVIEVTFSDAPMNQSIVSTTLDFSSPIVFSCDGKFMFNQLLIKVRGFLSLMMISKQLELREVRHELTCDRLDFGHAKAGKGRISVTTGWVPPTEYPLDIAFSQAAQPLAHEQLKAVRAQLRSNANILTIVEYINRTYLA